MAKIFIIQQLAAAVIIIIVVVVVVGSNKNLIGFSFITAYNSVFKQKCVQKNFGPIYTTMVAKHQTFLSILFIKRDFFLLPLNLLLFDHPNWNVYPMIADYFCPRRELDFFFWHTLVRTGIIYIYRRN